MKATRFPENPLISPEQVKPSREGWEVVSTLNAGAIIHKREVLLLLRVAERPKADDPNLLTAPMLDRSSDVSGIRLLQVRRDDPEVTGGDSRLFTYRGRTYLTSISHLRLARSNDGRRFEVEDQPTLEASMPYESFGVEDPRITEIEGHYLITYTAVSEHGIAAALASTEDFSQFTRHGVIFPPENRDVTIFPEKIRGRYFCLHRPVGRTIGGFEMWAANSHDLTHWGEHSWLMGPRPGSWDSARIGGGAVPIRTERGWLAIYHGADEQNRYSLGAVLCDLKHPERVIARSERPLLSPEAACEKEGFFGNVVFTCGAFLQDDILTIYYGAADKFICGASLPLSQLLNSLESSSSH
jgi:predicted GH43/DUF377 family glycosyl hydrolase